MGCIPFCCKNTRRLDFRSLHLRCIYPWIGSPDFFSFIYIAQKSLHLSNYCFIILIIRVFEKSVYYIFYVHIFCTFQSTFKEYFPISISNKKALIQFASFDRKKPKIEAKSYQFTVLKLNKVFVLDKDTKRFTG